MVQLVDEPEAHFARPDEPGTPHDLVAAGAVMARTINWNPEKLKALVEAYNATTGTTVTVKLPGEIQPADFQISYAKYLIEYLGNEFAKPVPVYPENREGKEGE